MTLQGPRTSSNCRSARILRTRRAQDMISLQTVLGKDIFCSTKITFFRFFRRWARSQSGPMSTTASFSWSPARESPGHTEIEHFFGTNGPKSQCKKSSVGLKFSSGHLTKKLIESHFNGKNLRCRHRWRHSDCDHPMSVDANFEKRDILRSSSGRWKV